VIGHELGHVLNRDILISSIAATLAAAITLVARMAFFFGGSRTAMTIAAAPPGGLVMLIVAPIAAMMIQMAISRTREYGADAAAAKYTGTPDGMINALKKLRRCSARADGCGSFDGAHVHPESVFGQRLNADVLRLIRRRSSGSRSWKRCGMRR
jgi:heat shock protein HtpX